MGKIVLFREHLNNILFPSRIISLKNNLLSIYYVNGTVFGPGDDKDSSGTVPAHGRDNAICRKVHKFGLV